MYCDEIKKISEKLDECYKILYNSYIFYNNKNKNINKKSVKKENNKIKKVSKKKDEGDMIFYGY